MRRSRTLLLPGLFLPGLFLAAACGAFEGRPESTAEDSHAQDAASQGDDPNAVEIPATVRRNLGITFARVEVRRVEETLRVPGVFELRPLARREYHAALPGRIDLAVDQYQAVAPGEVLYRFQSPAWPELSHEIIVGEQGIESARAEIAIGKARLDEARRRLAVVTGRIAALAQADFKKADLELAAAELEASLPRLEAELALAETGLENARRTRDHALHRAATAAGIPLAELAGSVEGPDGDVRAYESLDWIEVRAAEAGIVEQLGVTAGAFVEPPALVLSTIDPARVRFRALALQGDLPRLLAVRDALIVPPRGPGVAIDTAVPASVTLGLEAHPRERTLTLLATPRETAPWIRPGISAFLEVTTGEDRGGTLAVPRSAIVQDGLTHVFFRRDPQDPNRALRVEADMGASDGRWVELHSGVMRGDEVVLDGAYELKLATRRALGDDEPAGTHVHADGTQHSEH